MALRFNTFRKQRYFRSRFVEGKFLLASEASDIELEMLDLARSNVVHTLGEDVAIGDGWKVERLNSTQLLLKPGQAYFKGLPYEFRFGKDELVSGSILAIGSVPVGVTVEDEPNGLGKIIKFNNAATTPTNVYRIYITAKEQLITEVEDPFLQNVNITESTAQKIRLTFQLNIVPDSLQTDSPVPYRDETGTSLSVTNYPNSGGFSAPNLSNEVDITPTAAGNGELISLTVLSGSEGIDGRDLELVVRNNPALGGGNPIPNSPAGQAAFANGTLIDSNGNEFHINAIFNDTISTQAVIRIDKEHLQPNPEIINTKPFTLIKREVFVTDDTNGTPQGRLHWAIATVDWHQTTNFSHDSDVVDLRTVINSLSQFEYDSAQKSDLIPTEGGNIDFNSNLLTWSSDISLINAYGPNQTISANTVAMLDGGALVYEMKLSSGGIISKGNLAITIVGSGSTITVGALDNLSTVKVGNVIRIGSEISEIISINNTTKQVEVSPAITTTGAATIYLDSFAAQKAPFKLTSYVFAARKGAKVWIGGGSLELEDGETSQIGDGISQELLTYMGATGESDSDPNYSSTTVVTQGSPLNEAIGDLDADVGAINAALAAPLYDERILYPTGLPAATNIPIPNNSRNSGNPHFYVPGSGDMIVFVNQLIKFPGTDYTEVDNQTISFIDALPNDSEVRFRDAVIGGGTAGGGGSGSLQDAYNIGNVITTITNPFTVGGTASKVAQFNGDIGVTGVIDPTGLEFTPIGTNPLAASKPGLWVNLSGELVHEDGASAKNISQSISNLEAGTGVSALTRLMFNGTGSLIPKGTPVYSPTPGQIAPGRGTVDAESRIIGVTSENIASGTNGLVAFSGVISGITGFSHGTYLYLGDDAGESVDVEPTLGPYPSGFNVVILGVIENNNLILQIHKVGVL